MTLIDSHCHLNFSAFADDYNSIIADCLAKDIGVINIGSQYDTSKRAIEIANQYPNDFIYASIGLHPIHLSGTESDEEEVKYAFKERSFDEKKYQELINNDKSGKIVAVGETGLDYWHEPENTKALKHLSTKTQKNWKELQKDGFVAQLKFAAKNNLPVILHARGSKNDPTDAHRDMLEILKSRDEALPRLYKGVLHSFDSKSTKEIAKKFLDLGFCIGFTGVITFKNKSIDELREIVKFVPLDKILVETDAPYLAPEPHRGQKNKPQYVEFVARKVAEIKNDGRGEALPRLYNEVCQATTENVKRLFKIM